MKIAETSSVASRIEQAFRTADGATGASFDYLVKTAARESSFDEDAKAKTSSASGLFQFIESTWLETMKEAGPLHGLSKYSDQITRTRSGKYRVDDPQIRKEILALRDNAEIASLMAGAFTEKNANYLTGKLGRQPNDGELYIAHFLGASGANKLITLAENNPNLSADSVFTRQAKANQSIFYNQDGSAKSVADVYANLVSKHGGTSHTMIARADLGTASPTPARAYVPSAPVATLAMTEDGLKMANPSSRVTSAWAVSTSIASPFHALFSDQAYDNGTTLAASFLNSYASNDFFQAEDGESGAEKPQASVQLAQTRSSSSGNGNGAVRPHDLTGYLNYRPFQEPKDILPPV